MGAGASTQAIIHPVKSTPVSPKTVTSKQLIDRQNAVPSTRSQPSAKLHQTGLASPREPISPSAHGFVQNILGIRTPRISSQKTAYFPNLGQESLSQKRRSATNEKIQQALHKRKTELKEKPITFSRLILKFERNGKVLHDVKKIFEEVSNGKPDGLSLQGLQEAITHLEIDMSKEDVADLFGFIDLDGSLKIELKEFLVALTIGMVLDKIPAFRTTGSISPIGAQDGAFMKSPRSQTFISKTLQVKELLSLIITAYLLFDPLGEGFIRKESVEKIIEEVGHSGKNAMLSGEKWKQMDWDSNGTIDFAEFVIAFSTWIDLDDIFDDSE